MSVALNCIELRRGVSQGGVAVIGAFKILALDDNFLGICEHF